MEVTGAHERRIWIFDTTMSRCMDRMDVSQAQMFHPSFLVLAIYIALGHTILTFCAGKTCHARR